MLRDVVNALRAMGASMSRTVLATLGIVIAVMSVLAVSSIGASAQNLVISQVTSFGGNLLVVIPGGSQKDQPPPLAYGVVVTTLTKADVDSLGKVPGISAISPYVVATESVRYSKDAHVLQVVGVNEQFVKVEDVPISEGRFFDKSEADGFARVAVIGAGITKKLAPGRKSLVGDRILIGGQAFQVVGQIGARGSSAFQNYDEAIYVPVSTAQRTLKGINYVNAARARLDGTVPVDTVKADVAQVLRQRHRITDPSKDDFSIRTTDEALAILGSVTGAIKWFLILVTSIALLVGGINVMNVMYVAVKERTREIGLRKALGANRGRILFQFMVESALMSFIGGLVGALLGTGFTFVVAIVIRHLGYSWDFILPFSTVVEALVVATLIGIVFGVSPALSASRMDPITALRDE